jgi:ankyrin repeat protein
MGTCGGCSDPSGARCGCERTGRHLKFTPLHLARGEEVARLLLKHGADANAGKDQRSDPVTFLSENGREGAARVVLEHGVDAMPRDANNATPLHLASQQGINAATVRLLLQYGADVHARDNKGRTP